MATCATGNRLRVLGDTMTYIIKMIVDEAFPLDQTFTFEVSEEEFDHILHRMHRISARSI